MSGLAIVARYTYPDRVVDRLPNTSYSVNEWLTPRPQIQVDDDWLLSAFAVARDPALTGRFPRRAG